MGGGGGGGGTHISAASRGSGGMPEDFLYSTLDSVLRHMYSLCLSNDILSLPVQ